MYRCLIAFLCISSSHQSLGAPVNESISLKNVLTALANRCNNEFISDRIKGQIESCSNLTSPHGEKQLQCLMFYDINTRLCTAATEGKLAITEDYNYKITEEQDVNIMCNGAKDWNFTDLPEFIHYKKAVNKVFKYPIPCGKICGVEELMSDDANYFCKYFKWGIDILKSPVMSPFVTQEGLSSVKLTPEVTISNAGEKPEEASNTNEQLDLEIKNTAKAIITKLQETINVTPAKVTDLLKPEIPKTETTSQMAQNRQVVDPKSSAYPESTANKEITSKVEDSVGQPDFPSKDMDIKPPVDTLQTEQEIPKPSLEEAPEKTVADPVKTDDKDIPLDHKEPVIDNPKVQKLNPEVEDYQDSEEGKEGLGDMQGGDDGEDPTLEETNNKPEEKENIKKVDTIVSTFTGERDYYPNPIQDGFTEDGDHFFPFFLTAVILVVILYILYHNKNKVGKVFFGLILEGRSSSRRRNSRGHAYRRLDTLEQAMSANTAAPPSKIIY